MAAPGDEATVRSAAELRELLAAAGFRRGVSEGAAFGVVAVRT
ncbi:hypothetical protein [Streptomyces avicenniae]|nr:hypothetical protein [Streptomyces avicenniae]